MYVLWNDVLLIFLILIKIIYVNTILKNIYQTFFFIFKTFFKQYLEFYFSNVLNNYQFISSTCNPHLDQQAKQTEKPSS